MGCSHPLQMRKPGETLHPTTGTPDPGLELPSSQPALHGTLCSSLLTKNPRASARLSSQLVSEVERVGLLTDKGTVAQRSQGALPKSHSDLTDELEFKFHVRSPSQTPCLCAPEASTQGMCLTESHSLCPRTDPICASLALEGSFPGDSDPYSLVSREEFSIFGRPPHQLTQDPALFCPHLRCPL